MNVLVKKYITKTCQWRSDIVVPTDLHHLYILNNHDICILYQTVKDKYHDYLDLQDILFLIKNIGVSILNDVALTKNTSRCYLCSSQYKRVIKPNELFVNNIANIKQFKQINAVRVLSSNQYQLLYSLQHDNEWFIYNQLVIRPWYQIEHHRCMWCYKKENQHFPSMCYECYQFSLSHFFTHCILPLLYFDKYLVQDIINIIYSLLLQLYNLKVNLVKQDVVKHNLVKQDAVKQDVIQHLIKQEDDDLITEDNVDFYIYDPVEHDYDGLGTWDDD
ncbi:MAG TPA: hypothetical protein VLG50_05230 [Candidatus Saccharimonadales bacterium]|nr:hypothetical protein [Candidatus Saccharimonadales bacterium]